MKQPKPERFVVTEGMPICGRSSATGSHHSTHSATHHGALRGRVPPRFVIAREDAEMASTDELLVVEAQNRIVRVQKVRMEDDLDAVVRAVEELDAADLIEDGVVGVVSHIVRRDGREGVALEGEDAALEQDLVLLGEQLGGSGDRLLVAVYWMRFES